MAMNGCVSTVRYLLIGWNCLLVVVGLAMLGTGVWVLVDPDSGQVLRDSLLSRNPLVINYSGVSSDSSGLFRVMACCLIALGSLLVAVTVLDIVGVARTMRCPMGIACSLLCLVLIAMIGGGIYLYVRKDQVDFSEEKLKPLLRKSLQEAVSKYYDDRLSQDFMDEVQDKFKCCGAEKGVEDYAPAILTPCNMAIAHQGCLEPYYDHVVNNLGLKPFFQGKMNLGVWILFGTAGLLLLTLLLTGTMIFLVGREEQ